MGICCGSRKHCNNNNYYYNWGGSFIILEKSYEVAKADVVVKPVEVKTENKRGRFSDF